MISMLTVLKWQKSSVLVCLIAFHKLPLIQALFLAEKVPGPFTCWAILLRELPAFYFPAGHVHKNQIGAKINVNKLCCFTK